MIDHMNAFYSVFNGLSSFAGKHSVDKINALHGHVHKILENININIAFIPYCENWVK